MEFQAAVTCWWGTTSGLYRGQLNLVRIHFHCILKSYSGSRVCKAVAKSGCQPRPSPASLSKISAPTEQSFVKTGYCDFTSGFGNNLSFVKIGQKDGDFTWRPAYICMTFRISYVTHFWLILLLLLWLGASCGSVEALRYKPEGRGFDSRCCHWKVSFEVILPAAVWHWGPLSP